MEINVKISCPDLTMAASVIAKALPGAHHEQEGKGPAVAPAPVSAPVNPTHASGPIQTTVAPPAATGVAPAPSPAAPAAPVAQAPVAQAPVNTAPQITLDQIGKAGADLLNKNPGAMPQLMGLLQKYGVQSAQQLKPDQIGAFATELRALGAVI